MSASIWSPGSNNVPVANPNSQIVREEFTATAGQTDFTLTTFTYALTSNAIAVYVNGVKQASSSITELSTTSFRIVGGVDAGDLVEVIGNTESVDAEGAAVQAVAAAAAAQVSETNAANSASSASTSASTAVAAASSASNDAALVSGLYDNFDDRYLGAKSSDPVADNDGNAIQVGALYFNTVVGLMKVYTGSTWKDVGGTVSFDSQLLSGDGVTTAFTLNSVPATTIAVDVFVSGVRQYPVVDYVLSGSSLTFVSAPPSGSNNILCVWGTVYPSIADGVVNGNVTIVGTGKRITGDFTNATVANRVMFQTSTVNGSSSVGALPNGSSTSAFLSAFSASDPTNSSNATLYTDGTICGVSAGRTGSGSFLPLIIAVNNLERMRFDTSGNALVTNSGGGLGYGTGSGGTVTQATSKSTAVTLNKPTGQITMNNAALGAGVTIPFVFNNSLLAATDQIVMHINGGAASAVEYIIGYTGVTSGSCTMYVKNISAGSLSEALVITYTIIKGATS